MRARAGGERNDALSADFVDFLSCLDEQKVGFVLVGAYALGVHGIVRATGDLDVLYRRDLLNAIDGVTFAEV